MLTTRTQVLAYDLAEALNDKKHLGIYMWLAKKYPEGLLRQVLSEVKTVFYHKDIRRKGAYFLVSFYNKLKK